MQVRVYIFGVHVHVSTSLVGANSIWFHGAFLLNFGSNDTKTNWTRRQKAVRTVCTLQQKPVFKKGRLRTNVNQNAERSPPVLVQMDPKALKNPKGTMWLEFTLALYKGKSQCQGHELRSRTQKVLWLGQMAGDHRRVGIGLKVIVTVAETFIRKFSWMWQMADGRWP
jgi:hypothetical protein